ncbi:hypothetical protein BpHYR1_041673 [Brachionus plicatilis]|uniref:Uncharacterized protein n=1 Tax=Brachionus plicatilis TaxID=10195 RepID=A0A3M7STH2_BRAPC|nr:hypothetical protein BpHYR1_041673 [Brachionus plicatilis]
MTQLVRRLTFTHLSYHWRIQVIEARNNWIGCEMRIKNSKLIPSEGTKTDLYGFACSNKADQSDYFQIIRNIVNAPGLQLFFCMIGLGMPPTICQESNSENKIIWIQIKSLRLSELLNKTAPEMARISALYPQNAWIENTQLNIFNAFNIIFQLSISSTI